MTSIDERAEALATDIRHALRSAADPSRAPQMQAYMKSVMPFLGVPVPEVRKIVKALVQLEPELSVPEIQAAAGMLFGQARYREERYAATALTTAKQARGALELLPLHREMIVTGAWWDHVDEGARRIGELLVAHRLRIEPEVRRWSVSPDRWLRRAAILCQLGLRAGTDLDLLSAVITPNMHDREFFIRKAIGWALRDYARTGPDWVIGFVDHHRTELQPLSVREALKHLD